MKAVIYARYSSDNQREESIEGQLRECQAFAEKNDITVLNSYIDRAYSAKSDDRPAFQKMIKDSGKKLFDVIIVWKLDRFARNRYDSAHYKAMLRKNNVKVMSATEIISNDPTGILLESVLEGMAEYYSADLAEKVIRGMTENVLKGLFNGGTIPFGYVIDKDKHFQIDPIKAPIVVEIFKKYSEGETMKELADYYSAKGIKSSRGGAITINFITNLLKNRRYIGEYRFREVVTPGAIPSIIDDELFNKVQKKMAKNKRAPARHKAKEEMYLLSTKLFCGSCEALMRGESGRNKTGKAYRYYKCATAKNKKGCSRKPIKKDYIEDMTIDYIKRIILDDELMDKIADMLMDIQDTTNTGLPLLKTQLTKAEKNISNILDAIQEGVFNSSTKGRLDELEATKEKLEIAIAKEEIQHVVLTKEQILFWLHQFRLLDTNIYEHRQRLVDSFVNAIYIYDDKIVFTFNYKDGAKTVKLTDIECSDLDALAVPFKKSLSL